MKTARTNALPRPVTQPMVLFSGALVCDGCYAEWSNETAGSGGVAATRDAAPAAPQVSGLAGAVLAAGGALVVAGRVRGVSR